MGEVAEKKEFTTTVSTYTKELTLLVTRDFEACGVTFDEYSKKCAMAAMSSIYQLAKDNSANIKDLDASNLREIVGQAAGLKLNANAVPRECYFQLRKKNVNNTWVTVVEMGIEGDGNDALLRNFGENVDTVYPVWIVKEGDEFVYPRHKGIEMTPPEWIEMGMSNKVVKVVYPLKLKDGSFEYLISEREGVKVNLFAHVRNNLMNETFGIVTGVNSKGKPRTRYDATAEEKKQIDAKKEEIYNALRACETIDDMLSCKIARPFMSPAWLDTPESMIVRKMRNNAVKKYRKDFNDMARNSFNQLDETYTAARQEIEDNANTEEYVADTQPQEIVDGEMAPFEG